MIKIQRIVFIIMTIKYLLFQLAMHIFLNSRKLQNFPDFAKYLNSKVTTTGEKSLKTNLVSHMTTINKLIFFISSMMHVFIQLIYTFFM